MKKKEAQKKLQEVDEFIRKETTDNNIPIESGDWIDNLKKGDRIYSAGFEKDAEGKETVKVLTLQFEEYDKQSIATPNVRMAKLLPIIDDKIPENVKLPIILFFSSVSNSLLLKILLYIKSFIILPHPLFEKMLQKFIKSKSFLFLHISYVC